VDNSLDIHPKVLGHIFVFELVVAVSNSLDMFLNDRLGILELV
jgi:hypothetical protein